MGRVLTRRRLSCLGFRVRDQGLGAQGFGLVVRRRVWRRREAHNQKPQIGQKVLLGLEINPKSWTLPIPKP